MSIFKKFVGLFTTENIKKFLGIVERISEPAAKMIPYVETVANLTANRTDDSILNAYKTLGFENLLTPGTDKATALRELTKLLVTRAGLAPANGYLFNLAIEMAYAKYRESVDASKTTN